MRKLIFCLFLLGCGESTQNTNEPHTHTEKCFHYPHEFYDGSAKIRNCGWDYYFGCYACDFYYGYSFVTKCID